jgi:hypothetical protein
MITISQLLTNTWQLIQSHTRVYGVYLLLLVVPTFCFILLQQVLVDTDPDTLLALINTKNAIIGIITRIIISITTLIVILSIIYSTHTLHQQQSATYISSDLQVSLSRILPAIALNVLVAVLISVSFLFFIIPGIIVSIWLAFSYHVFVIEKLGVIAAIKRSKALVLGRFWQVFTRLAVLAIMTSIIYFIITILPTIITPLLGLDTIMIFIRLFGSAATVLYVVVAMTIYYHSLNALSPSEQQPMVRPSTSISR